jgi:hypothetical protein
LAVELNGTVSGIPACVAFGGKNIEKGERKKI